MIYPRLLCLTMTLHCHLLPTLDRAVGAWELLLGQLFIMMIFVRFVSVTAFVREFSLFAVSIQNYLLLRKMDVRNKYKFKNKV